MVLWVGRDGGLHGELADHAVVAGLGGLPGSPAWQEMTVKAGA
jgi:hypothetical protein